MWVRINNEKGMIVDAKEASIGRHFGTHHQLKDNKNDLKIEFKGLEMFQQKFSSKMTGSNIFGEHTHATCIKVYIGCRLKSPNNCTENKMLITNSIFYDVCMIETQTKNIHNLLLNE